MVKMKYSLFWDVTLRRLVVTDVSVQPFSMFPLLAPGGDLMTRSRFATEHPLRNSPFLSPSLLSPPRSTNPIG